MIIFIQFVSGIWKFSIYFVSLHAEPTSIHLNEINDIAKYIKQEMPKLNGTDEPQVYYRLKTDRNISSKEFVKHMIRRGSVIDRAEYLRRG